MSVLCSQVLLETSGKVFLEKYFHCSHAAHLASAVGLHARCYNEKPQRCDVEAFRSVASVLRSQVLLETSGKVFLENILAMVTRSRYDTCDGWKLTPAQPLENRRS